jgi:hypothetical protein
MHKRERAPMERDKPLSPFSLAARATPHDIRDKDNTQMQPKPPEQINHPRLAPGGSVGIRPNRMPPPPQAEKAAPSAQRPSLKREIGKPSDVHREFKSLVSKAPDKSQERGR